MTQYTNRYTEKIKSLNFDAIDLLGELSQYYIGNIDKYTTQKELKKIFIKMTIQQNLSFVESCDKETLRHYDLIKMNPTSKLNYESNIRNIILWRKMAEKCVKIKYMESLK